MTADPQKFALGADITTLKHGQSVVFVKYLIHRPMPIPGLLAAEAVVDVRMTYSKPIGIVWAAFKDLNLWMNRYGYRWTGCTYEEDSMVYLGNKSNEFGTNVPYVVRRVVPEHLIYLESLPHPLPNKDGYWSGHNVIQLWEEGGKTKVTCFMEHTFFSQVLPIEQLRTIAADLMFEKGAIGFWREYCLPDLDTLIEKGTAIGG